MKKWLRQIDGVFVWLMVAASLLGAAASSWVWIMLFMNPTLVLRLVG